MNLFGKTGGHLFPDHALMKIPRGRRMRTVGAAGDPGSEHPDLTQIVIAAQRAHPAALAGFSLSMSGKVATGFPKDHAQNKR